MDPAGTHLAGEPFCRRCGRRAARAGQRMVRIAIRENKKRKEQSWNRQIRSFRSLISTEV